MKIQKTWFHVRFSHGNAYIELSGNYETKKFDMYHGNNDNNITFNGDSSDFQILFDRAKCVIAALKYAQKELGEPYSG